ncbi:hypothetical protein CCACVL1_18986 [Corchorus capsularis]|uniref:Uncharacterized protein n=1 Tax=Corchorus capsularis TaxID=210143 RepID=A0A1R3HIZ4_COCAP|nr:hypothetical protein CCACVL1_18986 [Corchorus capsularis]
MAKHLENSLLKDGSVGTTL